MIYMELFLGIYDLWIGIHVLIAQIYLELQTCFCFDLKHIGIHGDI